MDEAVAVDFKVQVDALPADSDGSVANGLLASTREVLREVSEAAIQDIQTGKLVRDQLDEVDAGYDAHMTKMKTQLLWPVVWLRRRSGPIRRLAHRFPAQLGWLNRTLDYLGARDEPKQ